MSGSSDRQMEKKVTPPRVADCDRPIPAEVIEHRYRVGDLASHLKGTLRRGWLQTALLVRGDLVTAPDLVSKTVEVAVRQARATVEQ